MSTTELQPAWVARTVGLIAGLLLLSAAETHGFQVFPERDWSFTVGSYRFGYVEWPREVAAANYTNAKPFEFYFGPWRAKFDGLVAPSFMFLGAMFLFTSGLALILRRSTKSRATQ